jgi:hypothetical protein
MMPLFYFHVCNGKRVVDIEGSEHISLAEAYSEAVDSARDLLADGAMRGLDLSHSWIEVTNSYGEVLLNVRFGDALTIDAQNEAHQPH